MYLGLKSINKSFNNKVVFSNLEFDFSKCGLYLLSGESGSGKTTLLNIIAGYESIDVGKVVIPKSISIACIFQSYELITQLTVKENIYMASELFNQTSLQQEEIIGILGLEEVLEHYPNELSQGQKQRVGIARAIFNNPKIILCDEPTESLDAENKDKVLTLLKFLAKDRVVIVSSHDIQYMKKYYSYHYHIENNKLVEIDKRESLQIIENSIEKDNFNKEKLHYYIHKIVHKKTIIFSVVMSLLMIFQVFMFSLDRKLFDWKFSQGALNANVIYVQLHGASIESLSNYSGIKEPILAFAPLEIKGRSYKINMCPMVSTNEFLNVREIENNEILINQNVFEILKQQANVNEQSILDYPLTLSYEIAGVKYPIDYKIVGIIEETDVLGTLQIYYSPTWMNSLLKKTEGFDIWDNQYQYLQEEYTICQMKCDKDNIEKIYTEMSKNNKISISNSILTQKEQNEGQKKLYHSLFIAMEVILLLGTIGYMIYSISKDTRFNMFSLSLLHSTGISIDTIKHMYCLEKNKYMAIVLISYCTVLTLLYSVFDIYKWLIIAVIYVLIICVFYNIVLRIELQKFTKTHISMILKENKD